MRDKRFIAEHRGGPLKKEEHVLLAKWSCKCVERVLPLAAGNVQREVMEVLAVAKAWMKGKASVGDARKAAVKMLALARKLSDPVAIAIVRAAGHAVATAHMADHSPGGAMYALKAIKAAGKNVEKERAWQNKQLPPQIRALMLETRDEKEKHLRI